jgi:1-acyl-sn-glycerol-3-phosphate acyltransferase
MLGSVSRLLLKLAGWKLEGAVPASTRCVILAAPHTSNWDFYYMLLMNWGLGLGVSWMGKAPMFRPPFAGLMRRIGGIPVYRDSGSGMVDQMKAAFDEADFLRLLIPVEGTRSYRSRWRSGFYHIARHSGVPIVPTFLDYGRKIGRVGPEIEVTGRVGEDMELIREFYSGVTGRVAANFSDIVLAEEEQAAVA